MEVTLAKVMKYKNRLVEELQRVTGLIYSNNSLTEELREISTVEVPKLIETRRSIVNHIVAIKLLIQQKNLSVANDVLNSAQYKRILELQELKNEVSFYRGLNTQHGPIRNYYSDNNEVVNYTAIVRQEDVDNKVKELNKLIDKLQEEVDGYNHSTKVSIQDPFDIL